MEIPKEIAEDIDTIFALVLLGVPSLVCPPPAMPLCMFAAGVFGFVITPKISGYLTNQPIQVNTAQVNTTQTDTGNKNNKKEDT